MITPFISLEMFWIKFFSMQYFSRDLWYLSAKMSVNPSPFLTHNTFVFKKETGTGMKVSASSWNCYWQGQPRDSAYKKGTSTCYCYHSRVLTGQFDVVSGALSYNETHIHSIKKPNL